MLIYLTELEEIIEEIFKLAKDLKRECEEELNQLEGLKMVEGKAREKEEDDSRKKFITKILSDYFSQFNKALVSFETMDFNVERFTKVKRVIQDAVSCYCETYEEKRNKLFKLSSAAYQ